MMTLPRIKNDRSPIDMSSPLMKTLGDCYYYCDSTYKRATKIIAKTILYMRKCERHERHMQKPCKDNCNLASTLDPSVPLLLLYRSPGLGSHGMGAGIPRRMVVGGCWLMEIE